MLPNLYRIEIYKINPLCRPTWFKASTVYYLCTMNITSEELGHIKTSKSLLSIKNAKIWCCDDDDFLYVFFLYFRLYVRRVKKRQWQTITTFNCDNNNREATRKRHPRHRRITSYKTFSGYGFTTLIHEWIVYYKAQHIRRYSYILKCI